MTPRADAGFTLLEILVALVVLGFLMAGLSGGVQLGVRAWGQQSNEIAQRDELEAVDRALRMLVAGVDPGDRTHPAGIAGDAGHLRLLTILPQAVSGQQGEVELSAEGGVLRLHWRPRPPGAPIGPQPVAQATDLLHGISGLQVAYLPATGGAWLSGWDRADAPVLVRIRVAFPASDPAHRHWPDIVAGPIRAREGR